MLSNRFIIMFFLGATLLAWIIPSSWLTEGLLPETIPSSPKSPWSSQVSLDDVAWGNGSPYIRISIQNTTAPLHVSGWSLENEHGERAELGGGVELFTPGQTSNPLPLSVASNTTILVSFGPSPLGVSFREHACSGYLRGTIPVTPPLESVCPDLSQHATWNSLDDSCRMLITSLPRCTVVSPEHMTDMKPLCESFLRTVPTYASCIKEVGSGTLLPRWRLFVGEHSSLIHESGGTLILRDDQGMIVDILPYDTIGLKS